MRPLYEITGEYLKLLEMLDDSEADEESLTALANATSDELEAKANNYAKIIKNLETQLEGIKTEQQRLILRRAQIEKNIDWLKSNLQTAMTASGKTKFKTDLFNFNIQKNGGALPVIIDDVDKLPGDMIIINKKPDLKAIANYIKETGDVTFAHFGERGENLQIK